MQAAAARIRATRGVEVHSVIVARTRGSTAGRPPGRVSTIGHRVTPHRERESRPRHRHDECLSAPRCRQACHPMSRRFIDPMVSLISRARERDDVDLIYVNDNYGDFTADHSDDHRGRRSTGEHPDLVKPIVPDNGLPVPHQGPPQRLLRDRRWPTCSASWSVERLILTGQVTEQCILYTALDAYVRHFSFIVAPDAVAHIDATLADAALKMMQTNMRADLIAADGVSALTPRL